MPVCEIFDILQRPGRAPERPGLYGSDTHAEAAASIFSVITSCRLHRLEPFAYLDEILRVLPHWARHRYLELAPTLGTDACEVETPGAGGSLSALKIPSEVAPRWRHPPPGSRHNSAFSAKH
jgi:IS66 C-terminal element